MFPVMLLPWLWPVAVAASTPTVTTIVDGVLLASGVILMLCHHLAPRVGLPPLPRRRGWRRRRRWRGRRRGHDCVWTELDGLSRSATIYYLYESYAIRTDDRHRVDAMGFVYLPTAVTMVMNMVVGGTIT